MVNPGERFDRKWIKKTRQKYPAVAKDQVFYVGMFCLNYDVIFTL